MSQRIFVGVAPQTVLRIACAGEGLMALAALGWMYLRGLHVQFEFSGDSLGTAMISLLPLLAANFTIFFFAARAERHRIYERFLSTVVFPVVWELRWPGIVLLSALSGICEELLFRGAMLEELRGSITELGAVATTAFLFALVHFPGRLREFWQVFLLYVLAGLYLGWIATETENLAIPIVIHGVYNLCTLLCLVYIVIPRYRIEQSEMVRKSPEAQPKI